MKKLIAIAVAVVLVVGGFSLVMPASAEPDIVFEASIVPGAFNDHPLGKGEVKVYSDGTFEIEVEGCNNVQTYDVHVGQWVNVNGHGGINWYDGSVATLTTDEEGEGKVTGTVPSGAWSLFALNDWNESPPNEFVSGFQAP